MSARTGQDRPYEPHVGDVVTDTRTGREGRVMGHEGPRWQLRPLGGGCEWEADATYLNPNPSLADRYKSASDGSLSEWGL
ncbi:hypothetical protein GCM10018785_72960 [Streptomyces longispororuber]|uniref:Uncharacterized protein n=1 Tax=Streptomyces longispororuber TaxID=68230 RepID=A0A919E046_9ACTN|nr:hypothetical protein GCM10018785_72960 [Streptomyces longispororuber]